MSGLRFGPIGKDAVHAAIDMQVYFAENSDWAAPATHRIAANVARLAAHAPVRTIFTRFMTPERAEHAQGHWQVFYRRWQSVLTPSIHASAFDLLPALARFVPPARVIDKIGYSAFESHEFVKVLAELKAGALIFSGVETDACVLASALSAVDRGHRVILARDALASGSEAGHHAALDHIYPRLDQQVEIADTATILKEWQP